MWPLLPRCPCASRSARAIRGCRFRHRRRGRVVLRGADPGKVRRKHAPPGTFTPCPAYSSRAPLTSASSRAIYSPNPVPDARGEEKVRTGAPLLRGDGAAVGRFQQTYCGVAARLHKDAHASRIAPACPMALRVRFHRIWSRWLCPCRCSSQRAMSRAMASRRFSVSAKLATKTFSGMRPNRSLRRASGRAAKGRAPPAPYDQAGRRCRRMMVSRRASASRTGCFSKSSCSSSAAWLGSKKSIAESRAHNVAVSRPKQPA